MKKSILFILLFAFATHLMAQSRHSRNHRNRSRVEHRAPKLREIVTLDIGGKGLGLTYELPTSRAKSITISGGIGAGYQIYPNRAGLGYADDENYAYNLTPKNPSVYAEVARKRYYDLKGGRSNSGKFVALSARYTSASLGDDIPLGEYNNEALHLTAHWGKQRRIGSSWVLNYHLGVGYAQNIEAKADLFYPAAGFKFARNL